MKDKPLIEAYNTKILQDKELFDRFHKRKALYQKKWDIEREIELFSKEITQHSLIVFTNLLKQQFPEIKIIAKKTALFNDEIKIFVDKETMKKMIKEIPLHIFVYNQEKNYFNIRFSDIDRYISSLFITEGINNL